MMRVLVSTLLAFAGFADAYGDILARGNGGPNEVIDVSFETQMAGALMNRRLAEERGSNAVSMTALADRRAKVDKAMAKMLKLEDAYGALLK